jgi:hypothetical protein
MKLCFNCPREHKLSRARVGKGSKMSKAKVNPKVIDAIAADVAKGISVANCASKLDVSTTAIWNYLLKHPSERQKIDDAYKVQYLLMMDEVGTLSTAPLTCEGKDKMAELQWRRLRIDSLKFILAKLAPRILPELREHSVVEQTGTSQVVIQNYAEPEG